MQIFSLFTTDIYYYITTKFGYATFSIWWCCVTTV